MILIKTAADRLDDVVKYLFLPIFWINSQINAFSYYSIEPNFYEVLEKNPVFAPENQRSFFNNLFSCSGVRFLSRANRRVISFGSKSRRSSASTKRSSRGKHVFHIRITLTCTTAAMVIR